MLTQIKKTAVAIALAFATLEASATTYDYSYTFNSTDVLSGQLSGDANGNLVTNLTNISASLNGVAFNGSGSLLDFAATSDGQSWTPGGIVSFDGTQNNFYFSDKADFSAATNYTFMTGSYAVPQNAPTNFAFLNIGSLYIGDSPDFENGSIYTPARWSLTAIAAPVPEPDTYAMLMAGLGLMGFVARRRK